MDTMPLLTGEIKDFVKKVKLAFVATVCPDGTPNLSPKGTIITWGDEHLAFADIYSPGTTANLLKNPFIEVNIVDIFLRKGYRFKGSGEVLSEGSLFESVLSFYNSAGSKFVIKNIVLIKVQRIEPVISPAYDLGISEEDVIKRWTSYWAGIYTFGAIS